MNRSLRILMVAAALSFALPSTAQQKPSPLAPYIEVNAPVLVLEHVTLIDGTGSAP